VHVTIVKPNEPIARVRIAGQVICHVRCPSGGDFLLVGMAWRRATVVTAALPQRSACARQLCFL
jgi:hypothetical protein